MQTPIVGRQEVLTLFLFQSQNGFANLATEKPGKMDVAEALDLSEKLVCTASQPPVRTRGPAARVNRGVVSTPALRAQVVVTMAPQDPPATPAWARRGPASLPESLRSKKECL